MIAYGYIALRQFPKFEKHVLAAEMRQSASRHPLTLGLHMLLTQTV